MGVSVAVAVPHTRTGLVTAATFRRAGTEDPATGG